MSGILVASKDIGWYAFAEIDPEDHIFVAGRTLVDPLSAPLVGFDFPIYKTSLPYSKSGRRLLKPSDEEIQKIADGTITELKADLEKMVKDAHMDAVLVEIAKSYDGSQNNKGNKWIIMGRGHYVMYVRGGPYTQRQDIV